MVQKEGMDVFVADIATSIDVVTVEMDLTLSPSQSASCYLL